MFASAGMKRIYFIHFGMVALLQRMPYRKHKLQVLSQMVLFISIHFVWEVRKGCGDFEKVLYNP